MLLIGMRRARTLRAFTVELPLLRTALLAFFLALGILAGYLLSAHYLDSTGPELERCMTAYLTKAQTAPTWETAAGTLWCFFRAGICAFLLGFSSIGVFALPMLCAAQGTLISFSLFCFAPVLGREGFLMLLALFGLRALAVIPCTLLLSSAALERSWALMRLTMGRRVPRPSEETVYYSRFALCCVCLFLAASAELWLVPRLLTALA